MNSDLAQSQQLDPGRAATLSTQGGERRGGKASCCDAAAASTLSDPEEGLNNEGANLLKLQQRQAVVTTPLQTSPKARTLLGWL